MTDDNNAARVTKLDVPAGRIAARVDLPVIRCGLCEKSWRIELCISLSTGRNEWVFIRACRHASRNAVYDGFAPGPAAVLPEGASLDG